jgi:hypothetical protein
MSRRNLAGLIWVAFQASILVGYSYAAASWNPPTPQPTATTSSDADYQRRLADYRRRLAQYQRIPTASPGCPKTVSESEKYFYPCLGGNT